MVNLYDCVKITENLEGFPRGTYGVVLYCYPDNESCDVSLVDEEQRTLGMITCQRSKLLGVEPF